MDVLGCRSIEFIPRWIGKVTRISEWKTRWTSNARINYHQEGSRYVFLLSIPSVYVLRFARVTNMLASKLERLESVEIGHKGRRRHEKGLKKNRDVEGKEREREMNYVKRLFKYMYAQGYTESRRPCAPFVFSIYIKSPPRMTRHRAPRFSLSFSAPTLSFLYLLRLSTTSLSRLK